MTAEINNRCIPATEVGVCENLIRIEETDSTVRLWLILISNMSLHAEESAKRSRLQQERLQVMLSFIHQRFTEPISLQEIADTAHVSVSECARSFKKHYDCTPKEYRKNHK